VSQHPIGDGPEPLRRALEPGRAVVVALTLSLVCIAESIVR
jgi:hypothetical protein